MNYPHGCPTESQRCEKSVRNPRNLGALGILTKRRQLAVSLVVINLTTSFLCGLFVKEVNTHPQIFNSLYH